MERYDVAALGELLVDMTQYGVSEQGHALFEADPGGAPANVLAMLARLGKRCAFLGKVGRDSFGDMLERTLRDAGIDVSGLRRDPEVPTTLALVHTLPDGDRDFSFYRSPGADTRLRADELELRMLRACRIFHFGTLSLTDEPCRSATAAAVREAKAAGALLSFDPNLRAPLWPSPEAAREQIAWGLARCDILKIADDELLFMTGETDPDRGAAVLRARFPDIRLLCVTAGAGGSYAWYEDLRVFEPACTLGGVIETTGAGDAFCACVLNDVLERGLEGLSAARLSEMLRFANAAAYLVTTKKGALCSMPSPGEIDALLRMQEGRSDR